jgi:hypothetical protein
MQDYLTNNKNANHDEAFERTAKPYKNAYDK